MNYYKLKNIKYKNPIIIIIIPFLILILLVLLIIMNGYNHLTLYGSFTGNSFIVPVKLENSDKINENTLLKVDDEICDYKIKSISEIYNDNYINYQDYELLINKKFKKNEVKKIVIYYKKERMIKKILDLIL